MSKKRASGGQTVGEKDFGKPRDDEAAELKDKPTNYGSATNVSREAEEKKKGGRAKRKRGGIAKHHENGEDMKHAKHLGPVRGEAKVHSGRAPRASGGRSGSNFAPFSSARAGTPPRDHKVSKLD